MFSLKPDGLPDYVQVERKRVKHLRLVVNRDASVRLVLPLRASLKTGLAFFEARKAWVQTKRQQLLLQQQEAELFDGVDTVLFHGVTYAVVFSAAKDGIDHDQRTLYVRGDKSDASRMRVWRNQAAQDLRLRLDSEAERLDVAVNKVSIRDQKSRWGSCSSKGNISLNWRVALMPLTVGNYIIAHEFGHLKEMNHSAKFWTEVERLCPQYRDAERWIKTQGSALMMVQRS